MSTLEQIDVTMRLQQQRDPDGAFGAFTTVTGEIFASRRVVVVPSQQPPPLPEPSFTAADTTTAVNAGHFDAVRVHRHRIPPGYFISAMNRNSIHELQYVGSTVYEPYSGRPRLLSMVAAQDGSGIGDDDEKGDFLFIRQFHINDEWKENGNSDVGAKALHLLLHHSSISKSDSSDLFGDGHAKVSSAVYFLDPMQAMSTVEKAAFFERKQQIEDSRHQQSPESDTERRRQLERRDNEKMRMRRLARLDANQFLRNGFFQDPALVGADDENDYGIVVATYQHWSRCSDKSMMISHAEVQGMTLPEPPSPPATPVGVNAEIRELLSRIIVGDRDAGGVDAAAERYAVPPSSSSSLFLSLRLAGGQQDEDEDDVVVRQSARNSLLDSIRELVVNKGGSLVESHALQAACAHHNLSLIQWIVQQDPSTINACDGYDCTPLMVAAMRAGERMSNRGELHDEDNAVLDWLLANGSDRDQTDNDGMTAYGHFVQRCTDFYLSMSAMSGDRIRPNYLSQRPKHSSELLVEHKLYPMAGPTAADRTGGEGPEQGYMDYSAAITRDPFEYFDNDGDNYGD